MRGAFPALHVGWWCITARRACCTFARVAVRLQPGESPWPVHLLAALMRLTNLPPVTPVTDIRYTSASGYQPGAALRYMPFGANDIYQIK